MLAYSDEGVVVCLCMGGGRQTVFILYCHENDQSDIDVLHCTCSRYWSRRNQLNCRSVIELNRTQSKDWVRLSSVIEHSRTKKTRKSSISALNRSNRTYLNVLIFTQNRQEQSNKTTRLSTIMKNKCSGFIEFAWSLCFTVALLSFPGPRGRYKSGGGLNLKGTL